MATATATQPKPKPTTPLEVQFLESLMSATGASKSAVLDALNAAAPKIGELVKRYLDEQASRGKDKRAPMARIARLEQRATERPARPTFALSRVAPGARTLADIMHVTSVPEAAERELEPHERTMLHALSVGNKAGRALALVLATHRGLELPADDPMAAKVAANRRQFQRNLELGAVARAVREKNGK